MPFEDVLGGRDVVGGYMGWVWHGTVVGRSMSNVRIVHHHFLFFFLLFYGCARCYVS